MLTITIPAIEAWDEKQSCFISTKEQTLKLEHSLISLSKWESKWQKPFYSPNDKTYEETIDYIKCMTVTPNVKPDVYNFLTNEHFQQIYEYIGSPMTATTFNMRDKQAPSREIVTAELIYYWMIALNIPFECEKWHINKLITLIRVCNVKNQTPKKMSKQDLMSRNHALNAARRKQHNSKG